MYNHIFVYKINQAAFSAFNKNLSIFIHFELFHFCTWKTTNLMQPITLTRFKIKHKNLEVGVKSHTLSYMRDPHLKELMTSGADAPAFWQENIKPFLHKPPCSHIFHIRKLNTQ